MGPPRDMWRTRYAVGGRTVRVVIALLVSVAALWVPARADAVASITCPQALLSFQRDIRDPIGTPYPITMSLSQCTTGFQSSALSYGSGTITKTTGTGVFTNNSAVAHHHVH